MASDPRRSRRRLVVLAGLEALAVLLVGIGFGLRDVRYGLVAAGMMMWINITIGGLRKR